LAAMDDHETIYPSESRMALGLKNLGGQVVAGHEGGGQIAECRLGKQQKQDLEPSRAFTSRSDPTIIRMTANPIEESAATFSKCDLPATEPSRQKAPALERSTGAPNIPQCDDGERKQQNRRSLRKVSLVPQFEAQGWRKDFIQSSRHCEQCAVLRELFVAEHVAACQQRGAGVTDE